jgi:hypothetical protein
LATASPGTYNLTGTAASGYKAWLSTGGAGAYAITGFDATASESILSVASSGSYVLTGFPTTVTYPIWPDVSTVLLGTNYGPTGAEYTGTFVGFTDAIKLDITTGRLIKLLTDKVVISL